VYSELQTRIESATLQVNNLSSKFASVFNEAAVVICTTSFTEQQDRKLASGVQVVRSHSETPFLADKKNDGSFKKPHAWTLLSMKA